MGFFSFIQEIAMDLGTANTIIISDDKIVVDEPSVVALDRRTDKMIAVGEKAKMMYEKTHDNIRTIRPLRDGVIADFTACEQMMRGLIKMVHTGSRLFSPSLRMVIGVPSGSTEVELRAVRDSAEHADGAPVFKRTDKLNEKRGFSAARRRHQIDIINAPRVKFRAKFFGVGVVIFKNALFQFNRTNRVDHVKIPFL